MAVTGSLTGKINGTNALTPEPGLLAVNILLGNVDPPTFVFLCPSMAAWLDFRDVFEVGIPIAAYLDDLFKSFLDSTNCCWRRETVIPFASKQRLTGVRAIWRSRIFKA